MCTCLWLCRQAMKFENAKFSNFISIIFLNDIFVSKCACVCAHLINGVVVPQN